MIYLVGCRTDDYADVKEAIDGHRSTLSTYELEQGSAAMLLVAFKGTTDELKRDIGFGTEKEQGMAPLTGYVLQVSAYAGFWPKSLWDWCQAYSSDN